MANRVCELLGIRYPVIEGGLAYVGNGLLAAAVSEAGGLGQVGSGGRSVEDFRSEVALAVAHTQKPLGVNVPLSEHHDSSGYFDVIEEFRHQLKAVSLSAGNPRPHIAKLKEWGLTVMTLASTPKQALKAEMAGADIVICEGYEAGGHNGPAEITTLVLVPAVVETVRIPVVAAGGIADGRAASAMFCLGAQGIQLGTRFVATTECQAHLNYKEILTQSHAEDTVVMEKSFGRVTRVLKSPFVHRILEAERSFGLTQETIVPLIAGTNNYRAAIEGKMDEGWVNCGQSVALIHDVLPAGEVVGRLISEVHQVLKEVGKDMDF